MNKTTCVSSCVLGDNERHSLDSCVSNNWITMGRKVTEFEDLFAKFSGSRYAVATNNGTTSLHLALVGLGIQNDDEVIVPDLTYIASANVVVYCGAKPVFCDVLSDTWCMDPDDVERKITPRTKAIMPVHLYGHPCDMSALRTLANRHGLALIEDAAEAHGAEVDGKRVGSLGNIGSFSFYGNKIITTGEGGMCTTDSEALANKMKLYRGQGADPNKRYWHSVIGYNYRMTDLQGAVGCAQMKKIEQNIVHHRLLAAVYNRCLAKSGLILPVELTWARNVYWLYSIVMPGATYESRDTVMKRLEKQGIETRPIFYPLHQLPPYAQYGTDAIFPVSCRVARGGISLPTHMGVSENDAEEVATTLLRCL